MSNDFKQANLQTANPNAHPCSGSDQYLSLFDRFHERNVKKDVEVLRRIEHIPELKGRFNTEVEEQLHSSFVRNNHFLNSMKPEKHIFLIRVLTPQGNMKPFHEKFPKIDKREGRYLLSTKEYFSNKKWS